MINPRIRIKIKIKIRIRIGIRKLYFPQKK